MQLIVQQLEAHVSGAIPTTLLFIVLVAAYSVLVQGPLRPFSRSDRALTEGAMEDAQKLLPKLSPAPPTMVKSCAGAL